MLPPIMRLRGLNTGRFATAPESTYEGQDLWLQPVQEVLPKAWQSFETHEGSTSMWQTNLRIQYLCSRHGKKGGLLWGVEYHRSCLFRIVSLSRIIISWIGSWFHVSVHARCWNVIWRNTWISISLELNSGRLSSFANLDSNLCGTYHHLSWCRPIPSETLRVPWHAPDLALVSQGLDKTCPREDRMRLHALCTCH